MTADTITAIKKALEDFPPMTLEFTPISSEGNSIIRPTDEFKGRYFTVIGCGDKQDALGQMMTLAVNAMPALLSTIESLQRENERLQALADRLKLEAQGHAMEARGANSTIAEIYQIISGARGEPGNWNGADPVRTYVQVAKGEILRLETELALSKPIYSRRQIEARAKSLEEALEPFAKFELSELKQRAFLQILVCPEGDDHADNYGPHFRRARTALSSTGDPHGN